MGSADHLIAILLCLFLLQPWWTVSPSFLSPFTDEVCKGVECGKGKCKASGNNTFLYNCECEPGWTQAGFSFLPCVIPNCKISCFKLKICVCTGSINYSCAEAPAPVQDKESRANTSIFDPCHWVDCGGGTCNKTSFITYNCECIESYYNLLNVSSFACYKECALGIDCSNLGIALSNKTTSPPPSLDDHTNQASSLQHGSISWMIMLTIIFAPFLRT